MIRYTLPEALACPEVSLMTGNSTKVSATIPWPILKIERQRKRGRGKGGGRLIIFILHQVWIKSVF